VISLSPASVAPIHPNDPIASFKNLLIEWLEDGHADNSEGSEKSRSGDDGGSDSGSRGAFDELGNSNADVGRGLRDGRLVSQSTLNWVRRGNPFAQRFMDAVRVRLLTTDDVTELVARYGRREDEAAREGQPLHLLGEEVVRGILARLGGSADAGGDREVDEGTGKGNSGSNIGDNSSGEDRGDRGESGSPLTLANERRTLAALLAFLEATLRSYPTTLRQDVLLQTRDNLLASSMEPPSLSPSSSSGLLLSPLQRSFLVIRSELKRLLHAGILALLWENRTLNRRIARQRSRHRGGLGGHERGVAIADAAERATRGGRADGAGDEQTAFEDSLRRWEAQWEHWLTALRLL
jgi:hypothetical protein